MSAKVVLLDKINKKRDLLRSFDMPPEVIKNLQEWFAVEQIYNSNALEGNTLTKRETALVVEKGLTIGGKSMREHLEVINYGFALDFIKELATKKRQEITLNDILDIHRLVLKDIDEAHAGRLRTVQVFISGSDIQLPSPLKVPEHMGKFVSWLQSTNEHPVKIAAEAHFKLVTIHPFVDGNGRTARLLMNVLLLQEGYAPAVIEVVKRLEYINAIITGEVGGDIMPFYELIFESEIKSLDKYLQACSF